MVAQLIRSIESEQFRNDIPDFRAGDTVRVHVRVVEGTRERTQIFEGVVIRRRGGGINENVTVRRIASHGIGVERTFLIHSPRVAKFELTRTGRVRRARLYYLRGLTGRAARIKERRRPLVATVVLPVEEITPVATGETMDEAMAFDVVAESAELVATEAVAGALDIDETIEVAEEVEAVIEPVDVAEPDVEIVEAADVVEAVVAEVEDEIAADAVVEAAGPDAEVDTVAEIVDELLDDTDVAANVTDDPVDTVAEVVDEADEARS